MINPILFMYQLINNIIYTIIIVIMIYLKFFDLLIRKNLINKSYLSL